MSEESFFVSNLSIFHCGFFAAFYFVVAFAIYVYHRPTKGALILSFISVLSGIAHLFSAFIFVVSPGNQNLLLALGAYCAAATPSIMLCIKEAISPGWLSKKRYWTLVSPYFIGMAICFFYANEYILYILMCINSIFTITCAVIFWKGIDRREKAVKKYFTDIESFGHGWVKGFIIFQILCSVGFYFLYEYLTVSFNICWNYVQAGFWLYFLLKCKEQRYYSTQIPDDLNEIIERETVQKTETSQKEEEKYYLSEDKMEYIERKLKDLADGKIYLNDNLTLSILSQEVGTNRTYLSAYFHLKDTTFYDYINGLRCEYAIEQMKRTPSKTVAEIACLCGYKTENSFRSAFVTLFDKTPAVYKRELRNQR